MKLKQINEATCKVECNGEKGTGFFVTSDKILTALHVVRASTIDSVNKISITNCDKSLKEEYEVKYVDYCEETDLALIDCSGVYTSEKYVELNCSHIQPEEKIYSYGYPNTFDGQLVGVPLNGTVLTLITDSSETIHDVSLNIENFTPSANYKGFSGSPVANSAGVVTSIIRYKSPTYMNSVSIRKAKVFLERNNLEFSEDELHSFSEYRERAFTGFEVIKTECDEASKEPIKNIRPIDILKVRDSELFYPKKQMSFEEIRLYLRNNREVHSKLWIGWLQFLTYMKLMDVDYSNIEDIKVKIRAKSTGVFSSLLRKNRSINYEINIKLFYTEDESYFEVARDYIKRNERSMRLKGHACHIFDSHTDNFGRREFNINSVVNDISSPPRAKFEVEKAKIGVLSLRQVTDAVISSDTSSEAVETIRKRFENAIV